MGSTRAAGLVAALALAVTSGCTAVGPDAASKSPLATASRATTGVTQSPQSVLDAALGKVRQSEAISFKSRTVVSISELVSTFDTSGVWESQLSSWRSTTIPRVSLEAFVTSTTKQRYVDSHLYRLISVKGASVGWSDETHGHDPYLAPIPNWERPGPMPTDLNLVSFIEPTAIADVGNNLVLTGTLPNRVGLEMLGLTGHLSEIGLVMYDQGRTTVHLTLDSTDFPVRLDILGSDVDLVSSKVPDYVKAELGASSYRADYAESRDVPPIRAPTHTVRLVN